MNLHLIVADGAAVCGVAFGLYTLLAQRRASRRHIRVTLRQGVVPAGGDARCVFLLRVVNAGSRTVTLTSPEIALPGGKRMAMLRPVSTAGVPCTLTESQDCTVIVDIEEVAHTFAQLGLHGKVKLSGQFTDSLGIVHRSGRMKVSADGVCQLAQEARLRV